MNAEGTLRVSRDVTVRPGVENEFIAIGSEPAACGERLTLERIVNGATVTEHVVVDDSRPALVDGSVRHRLRLRRIDEPATRNNGSEATTMGVGNR